MNITFKKLLSKCRQFIRDEKDRRSLSISIPFFSLTIRQKVNIVFKIRDKLFFKKKKPVSDAYPFTVIDPFEVFGEDNWFGDFNLVGDAWRDKNSDKPVALLWGFNNWKWGFVSDYLPEYRTAFAPRKILSLKSLWAIKRFPLKPAAFIFWGYTEPWTVRWYAKRWYAKRNAIKIYRMEDGFIRSSSLGATHSTPYSLLMDAKGLHYNPEEPSGIEEILNNHTFSEQELASAQTCMNLMQDLALSKYNPPSFNADRQSVIKIRKRVVVLGQVDNDKSIRLGNPDRWSMIELIRLAKFENPHADILYRPHPDVYQGYQKSKFRKRAVGKICALVSPEIPLAEFLDTVDHVYTITSLSGLEALLKGKKVTVVGAAFYAGWGLTDDRIEFPRRTTKRTLLELYAGVYLKYPRYLADLEDSEIGLQAACLRIKADYEISEFDLFKLQKADTAENIQAIAKSDYWPQLLFKKQTSENEALVQKAIDQINFEMAVTHQPGRLFQIVLIYSVCGICKSNSSREKFINAVREYIDHDILNFLLLDLSKLYPGEYIARQFAWLLAEVKDNKASLTLLAKELARSHEISLQLIRAANEQANAAPYGWKSEGLLAVNDANRPLLLIDQARWKSEGFLAANDANRPLLSIDQTGWKSESLPTVNDENKPLLSIDQAGFLLEMFEQNVSIRKIDAAIEIGKTLLLAGHFVSKIIQKMAQLSVIKFDKESAKNIANFGLHMDLYDQNRMMALIESNNFTDSRVSRSPLEFIQSLVKLIALKPDRINDAIFLVKKFPENFDDPKLEKIFASILALDNEQSIRKASGFIAIEKPLLAVKIMENLIIQGDHSEAVRIAYSQALSYADRLEEAMKVMEEARKLQKTSANYRETLRLYVLAGMYDQSLELLKDAQHRKIDLGDMHPRKVYFGCRMVKEALETFTKLSVKETVATYYPDKYFYTGNHAVEFDKLIALAIFGPGDEIRFASIYNLLPAKLVQKDISISCAPRLLKLFTRSFENLKFVPVARPRNTDQIDLQDYTNVLGSDLTGVIDNTATDAINNSDHVMLVTDMLHECLPSYEAFPGKPYLKHNDSLAKYYRNQLPKNTKLVGLSWRSSLTTHSRNEHYLTVEELEPIFKIDGVQFVNFQYDECQEELDWIENRYPGKVINIAEIDHYNDFDSVAALMNCMDLMIAPATTVVELAGALGCPTWLLSNSSELHWRKIDRHGTDVWHNSITHIEGTVLGDKSTLVERLCESLSDFVNQEALLRQSA